MLAQSPTQAAGSRDLAQVASSTAQLDQADVFARDGFDVTGYINEMFPSGMPLTAFPLHLNLMLYTELVQSDAEDSLIGLDPLIGNLKHKVSSWACKTPIASVINQKAVLCS